MAQGRKRKNNRGGERTAFTLEDWNRWHFALLDKRDRRHLAATAAVQAFLGLAASKKAALSTIQTRLQTLGGTL